MIWTEELVGGVKEAERVTRSLMRFAVKTKEKEREAAGLV